uniref:Putative secreted protein n=1 Tax=Ixodes ricinus TaxID=34613 RepID=A0A6B0UXC0_IXORI
MSRLWVRVLRIFMMRTTAASIWYCRSWYTRSWVELCSSCVSRIWIWLILMRKSRFRKSALNRNRSSSCTSRPRGTLSSTRARPHASDCSVRRSSPSSRRVDARSSASPTGPAASLKASSTSAWKRDTCSSLGPPPLGAGKAALSTQCPRLGCHCSLRPLCLPR